MNMGRVIEAVFSIFFNASVKFPPQEIFNPCCVPQLFQK